MTEKNKQVSAYLSWRTAWRMRCCPPDNFLYGENTRELTEHLQLCPWCREERDSSENSPNFPVIQRMEAEKKKVFPEVGQLWSLKQSLGNWGPKGRYYFPPLVVIIEVTATSVTVFQSYGDMDMAGSDDIPFQTDLVGFSQPWNRYSLLIDDLDICYGQVSCNPGEDFPSPENVSEQTAETGSLFWFFRQMEVETGYFFASQAIPSLISEYAEDHAEISDNPLTPFNDNLERMGSRFLNLGLVLPDPLSLQDSAIDLLFYVRAPDDFLPLAAADSNTESEYALTFTLQNEKFTGVKSTGMQITLWRHDGPSLYISGNLTETIQGNLHIFFRLNTKNQHFDPVPGEYGIEKDFFWALFHVEDADLTKGECIVRIITDGK